MAGSVPPVDVTKMGRTSTEEKHDGQVPTAQALPRRPGSGQRLAQGIGALDEQHKSVRQPLRLPYANSFSDPEQSAAPLALVGFGDAVTRMRVVRKFAAVTDVQATPIAGLVVL